MSVGPPSAQCLTWWACRRWVRLQPGNRQPRSRGVDVHHDGRPVLPAHSSWSTSTPRHYSERLCINSHHYHVYSYKKGQKWSRQQVLSLHPSRGLGFLAAGNSRRVVPSDIWTTGGGISDAPQKYRLPPHRDGLALRPRNGLGEPPVEPLGRPQEIAGKFVPSPLGSVGLLGSPFGIAGSPAAVRTWPFLVIGVPHKRADHQKSGDTGI